MMKRLRQGVGAAAVWLLLTDVAGAGGPLIVSNTGVPFVWDLPIRYVTDRGNLGMMTNAQAIAFVDSAAAAWSAVPTTSLSFVNAGLLANDVDTVVEFNAVDGCSAGDSAIVFDATGSLFTALGFSSGVIGFAGPECLTTSAPFRITKGIAALNGKWRDGNAANGELTEDEFFGVFVHEFGHFLNLDHSQTNGQFFIGDTNDPGFVTFGSPVVAQVERMFPFALDGMGAAPRMDDAAAISALYPAATFSATTGAISGRILRSDGTTAFQGANVVARNVLDPFNDAVSAVSGVRFSSGAPPALRGLYEIAGLTPGAGYSVEVTRVNSQFTGGSSVGPLSPPVALPGPEEFYNGVDESNDASEDEPLDFVAVPSVPGVPATGIDIVFQSGSSEPPPTVIHDLAVTKITAPRTVTVSAVKRRVTVKVQNRSAHFETIPDLATLANAVKLEVLPLSASCTPAPVVTLHTNSPRLPVTAGPKGTINVVFDVLFGCAPDPARGAGHEDYRFVATVDHAALAGNEPDDHPADDVCPHDALPTLGHRDPNPNGTIVDRGCGSRKPDGLYGGDVKIDVYVP